MMSSERTLVFFAGRYAPLMGGVETYTEKIANELAARGHHVFVVTCNVTNAEACEQHGNLTILRLPSRALLGGRFPVPRVRDPQTCALMQKIPEAIDGVLVNTRFYPLSRFGVQFAQQHGVVPVVLDHGSAYLTMGNPVVDAAIRAYEHGATARLMRYPARFYGISAASARWLETFGIAAEGVLGNAIDAEAFAAQASARDFRAELGLAPEALLVAFTGRYVAEKGLRELAEAARLLASQSAQPTQPTQPTQPPVHIVCAGEGPLAPLLEGQPNVHNVGRLSAPDIAALLLQADAFCLPSRSEGFSTALLEAAACGCALVSTNVGGAQELIPTPEHGIMLPDVQPQSIASALHNLASDRSHTAALASESQALVREQYSVPEAATAVLFAVLSLTSQ